MSVSDWSLTPSANLSISGIDISEGCPAANMNNATRQMMSDVRAFSDGMDRGAATTGESGVVDTNRTYGDSRRYGITADGSTNWEVSFPARMTSLLSSAGGGALIRFSRNGTEGHFKTEMNLDNLKGGATNERLNFHFEPGTAFGGLVHFVSSNGPKVDLDISAITPGNPTAITFTAAHGITANRYVDVRGVTGTIADTINVEHLLLIPTGTSTATLGVDTTGLAYTSGGLVSDSPVRADFTGTMATPGRPGFNGVEGIGENIRVLSDTTLAISGDASAGVHIYFLTDYRCNEIYVEDSGGPETSANAYAAVEIDGGGANGPLFSCNRIIVKDTMVNGVILNGRVCIGHIRVHAYGRSTTSLSLGHPAFGSADRLGTSFVDTYSGLLIGRCSGYIGCVEIDQEKGASARTHDYAAIVIDRDSFRWTNYDSALTNTYEPLVIGHAIIRNPRLMGIAAGAFSPDGSSGVRRSHTIINHVTLVVGTDNAMISDGALRAARALICQMDGYLTIKSWSIADNKGVTVFRSSSSASSQTYTHLGVGEAVNWSGNLVTMNRPGVMETCSLGPWASSGINGAAFVFAHDGSYGNIHCRGIQTQGDTNALAWLVDWRSVDGILENVNTHQVRHATDPVIYCAAASTLRNIKLRRGGSILAGSVGIELDGGSTNFDNRLTMQDVYVDGFALGFDASGTIADSSIVAINCRAGTNTADTDLTTAKLVSGSFANADLAA